MARRHTRLSVGALALTGFAATAVGLSAPASAETTNLVYTCEVPILGAQDFTVSLDTDAPESVTPGADVTAAVTGSVTLNDATINGMVGLLKWAEAEGVTTTALTDLTTPRTPVSATEKTLPLTGGSVMLTDLAAGEHTIDAPESFTSTFSGYKADGSAAGEFEIPCEYTSGTQVIDTITAEEAPVEDEPTDDEPTEPEPTEPEPTEPEPTEPEPSTDDDSTGSGDDESGPQRPDVVQTDGGALGASPLLLGGATLAGAAVALLATRRRTGDLHR